LNPGSLFLQLILGRFYFIKSFKTGTSAACQQSVNARLIYNFLYIANFMTYSTIQVMYFAILMPGLERLIIE